MKSCKTILLVLLVVVILISTNEMYAQTNSEIWQDFVQILKNGAMTKEKIKPYVESIREPIFQFLTDFQRTAVWEEWEKPVDVKRVNNKIHYIIPVAFGDADTSTFIFSFLIEDNQWYFHHMENIIIRLDTLSTFPTSRFPDVPVKTKQWILEEERWSFVVKVFNTLSEEQGKEFALNWLRDGFGYLMQAQTWVPLLEPEKAFILYVGWDLSNRRGNEVTLESFDKNEALIRFKSQFFQLYHVSGHLRTQISLEDYRAIFETIWQDRAQKAGWDLAIQYDGDDIQFHFLRKEI